MCQTCTERSDKCVLCKTGMYKLDIPGTLELGKCFSLASKLQHYLDTNLLKACDISCNGCTVYNENCKTCASGYYNIFENPISNELNFCYLPSSKTNYYVDATDNKLKLCDLTCSTCLLSAKSCKICKMEFSKFKAPQALREIMLR